MARRKECFLTCSQLFIEEKLDFTKKAQIFIYRTRKVFLRILSLLLLLMLFLIILLLRFTLTNQGYCYLRDSLKEALRKPTVKRRINKLKRIKSLERCILPIYYELKDVLRKGYSNKYRLETNLDISTLNLNLEKVRCRK